MEANDIILKLRETMKARKITQAEAAARLGVSQNMVSLYLAGVPRLDTLLKLCAALEIDPAQLFQEDPTQAPESVTGTICPHCKQPIKIVLK